MIRLENVTKRYGKKTVLDDITFSVGKGEIVGLLGRNGAGKSTTMNILTGYLPCTNGRVTVGNFDMLEESLQAKKFIGYLPEQPPVYDNMTVEEYLRFVGKIKQLPSEDLERLVSEICERVGLTSVRARLIRNISKGYRQRAGIAQAMLGDPEILILDEPTAGLDPMQIVEIRGLIREFGKSRTVIISSHILAEVSELCERALVLREGRLVGDQKLSELGGGLSETAKQHVRIAASALELRETLKSLPGVMEVQEMPKAEAETTDWEIVYKRNTDIRYPLFDALASKGFRLLISQPVGADIEDVFLQMTAGRQEEPVEEHA